MAEKEKLISSVKNLDNSTMSTSSNIVGGSKVNMSSLERGSRLQGAIKGFAGSDDFVSAKQTGGKSVPLTRQGASGATTLEQIGVNPQDVLSSQNIEETIKTPQEPVNDALGIFTAQEEAQGIPGLKEAYQTAQANRMKGEQLAKQEQLTIEGRAKKLGVLRGEQSQAAQQANLDLQTLGQAEQLALSSLQSAQATADKRAGILYNEYQRKVDLQLQFPGIDIDPTKDSFTDVAQKLDKYKEEEKKRAEKDAYKEALLAMGKSTKGSRKKLEKRLKKANKKAYEQAQRQSKIQLESMEISLEQAKKKLAEANKPTEAYLEEWEPDSSTSTDDPLSDW